MKELLKTLIEYFSRKSRINPDDFAKGGLYGGPTYAEGVKKSKGEVIITPEQLKKFSEFVIEKEGVIKGSDIFIPMEEK